MNYPILTTRITAQGLVPLRTRARQVGELFGLDKMQRTRFITALSEIARNAVQYAGGGTVTFLLDAGTAAQPVQSLLAQVADKGPGIADLEGVLKGRLNERLQVPLGIVGSRRLVDSLEFEQPAGGGTVATLSMLLNRIAPRLSPHDVARLVETLARPSKTKTPWQVNILPGCHLTPADLRALVARDRPAVVPELGAFWGGAVGYFGYDVVRYIERLPAAASSSDTAPCGRLYFTALETRLVSTCRTAVGSACMSYIDSSTWPMRPTRDRSSRPCAPGTSVRGVSLGRPGWSGELWVRRPLEAAQRRSGASR